MLSLIHSKPERGFTQTFYHFFEKYKNRRQTPRVRLRQCSKIVPYSNVRSFRFQ